MIVLLAALGFAQAPVFAPPVLWASGFAAPPRIPLVGDVDADGYADLICVYLPGGSIIDVSLNVKGQKPGVPFQALNPWGKDCQAAAAGEIDGKPGADVAGLFDGDTIQLAGSFAGGKFKSEPEWAKLPKKLREPSMAIIEGAIVVWSQRDRLAFRIAKDRQITPTQVDKLPTSGVPSVVFRKERTIRLSADMDADGDLDHLNYRYSDERHKGLDITIERQVTAGESDSDSDGLSNQQEAGYRTDPLNPDTDGDGLLDGWETGAFRELDFKALGCNPRRTDVMSLISRYSNVDEATVRKEMERVKKTYAELESPNPDGSKGFSFHPIYLDPVQPADHPNPWWVNRDKFRPAKWKGIVHWMQITPGGGGQADQMGDAGTCGVNALWAVFLHEFGHQIGMDHEGFWQAGLCPIYTSLMSYAYSYSLEDDGNKIRYSDGRFKDFVLNESKLDETLPLPYEKVSFLEKGPYRFRLKPNGDTTLIDWNWNGVFGEKNVRADINYSYSTNAGRRDEIGKIMTSPWLFTHQGKAWAVYGTHKLPGDVKSDPTISPEKPGELWLRELERPFKWKEPTTLNIGEQLAGDPVAVSKDGSIYIFFPSRSQQMAPGTARIMMAKVKGKRLETSPIGRTDRVEVPSVGLYRNRVYLFLWNSATGAVAYHTLDGGMKLSPERQLLRRSTIPVGMAVDTIRDEIILGAAEDQDKNRPSRWQIRRYKEINGRLIEKSAEWIEGEAGGSRGTGRATVLFDASKEAGPAGRIYFFARGYTTKESPWGCTYVAQQIADKSVRGGWLVKRFYDEWTQTRSAPAAAWFGGDIIWAYRWVDGGQGERDNLFHVGYRALGIDEFPMGDHDDITFFREIGIRRSILYLGG
ncbi:MAG: hypothetical protein WAO58_04690 [Fimbriimonadaceae bacterium]